VGGVHKYVARIKSGADAVEVNVKIPVWLPKHKLDILLIWTTVNTHKTVRTLRTNSALPLTNCLKHADILFINLIVFNYPAMFLYIL
jgi:hypothetical protein